MSWSLRKAGTAAELVKELNAAGPEIGSVAEFDKAKPSILRLLGLNTLKGDEAGPRLELDACGHEHDGTANCYVKLGPAAAAALILLALCFSFFTSTVSAAEPKLPARVETYQPNPPAPGNYYAGGPRSMPQAQAAYQEPQQQRRGWFGLRRCRRCQ